MDGIQEIDVVLQHVRQVAQRFRLSSDTAITQQILLFSDSFYGYRFTAMDFTAIWSAADQILKVFDSAGRVLAAFSTSERADVTSVESIPLTSQYKAA
jgi:hypothetical protein